MAEPLGLAVPLSAMNIVSWYGMLRVGIQLVHDDFESRKSAEEDVRYMLIDLRHQETSLKDWRRDWQISKQTPEEVFRQYWGDDRLEIIKEMLKRIEADLKRARKKLGKLAEMEGHWHNMGKMRRKYYKTKFIWTKKKFVQELIDRLPKNMNVIKEQSSAGWKQQQQEHAREVAHTTPYHTQVAHLLVQMAMQNRKDAEDLRECCGRVKDEIAVLLDLDMFDAVAAKTDYKLVKRIAQVHGVGHLKLELLLREAGRQQGELTRVVVEKAASDAMPESRVIDAFRPMLDTAGCTYHFAPNSSTRLCLSKFRREGDPCSRLQREFREVLADQDPPSYNAATKKFVDHELVLGGLSRSRVAFEMAQACLLFFRTTWIAGLCRCRLRCGVASTSPASKCHQFGLDIVETAHQPPLCRNPHDPGRYGEGEMGDSWCSKNFHWNDLNKPIRHLGLLLIEFSLSTIVLPETKNDVHGAAPVTDVCVRVKGEPGPWKWEKLSLMTVLKLVRKSLNDKNHIEEAVRHCLTESFPASPSDAEWERHLRRFYFKVVKPYVLPTCLVFLLLTKSV